MSDHVIADLMHALRGSPEDAALRIHLASELSRSARRGEALDVLDFSKIPFAHFPAAKELSERLWREEVAAMKVVFDFGRPRNVGAPPITLDDSGRLAVRDDFDRRELIDVERGEVVLSFGSRITFAVGRGAVVVSDEGVLHRVVVGSDGAVAISQQPSSLKVLRLSPRGDRVLGFGPEGFVIAALPSLDVVKLERIVKHQSGVIWDIPQIIAWPRTLLGDSMFGNYREDGVRVEHRALGWSRFVEFKDVSYSQLVGDGRTLRVFSRTDMAVFDLDPLTGAITTLRPRAWNGSNGWHPHAAIALMGVGSSEYGRFIQDEDRNTILELSNGYSLIRWEKNGRGFLARSPSGAIELHSVVA